MADVSMRRMLEAGVHFGHQTRFWNPKMSQFIFGERNKIHIINLERRCRFTSEAAEFVRKLVSDGGTLLFVGSKRAAREVDRRRGAALRDAVREPTLARRHAHELQDDPPIDQAAPGLEEITAAGGSTEFTKKEMLGSEPRARKARARVRRHQADGRPAGCRLHHRRWPRGDRGSGSEQARHPGRRRGRHELLARTASTIRFPATTMRCARFSSTPRASRTLCSTASPRSLKCRRATTSSSSSMKRASRRSSSKEQEAASQEARPRHEIRSKRARAARPKCGGEDGASRKPRAEPVRRSAADLDTRTLRRAGEFVQNTRKQERPVRRTQTAFNKRGTENGHHAGHG